MHTRVRRIVFLAFFIAFFISAPIVVLYTAGYRFSWQYQTLVRTGLLSLATIPKGATVILDGKYQKQTTPVLLNTLLPGLHEVRLEKEGYYPWKKILEIQENTTTFMHTAVLFLQNNPLLTIPENFPAIAVDPQGKHIAYAREENEWTEIWSQDMTGAKTLLLRLPDSEFDDLTINWSPKGTYILIKEEQEAVCQWRAMSPDGQIRLDVNTLFSSPLSQVSFDPTWDHLLYATDTQGVHLLDLLKQTTKLIAPDSFAALQTEKGMITLETTGDRITVRKHTTEPENQILAYIPKEIYRFLPAPEGYYLLETASKKILLLDASGADRPILLHTDANHVSWSPENGRQLLYANDFEIHIYDADNHTDELLTRLSRPIGTVRWYPTAATVLYTDTTGLFAIELDRRDRRNVFTLGSWKSIEQMWIDPKGKKAFVVGSTETESGLFEVKLEK